MAAAVCLLGLIAGALAAGAAEGEDPARELNLVHWVQPEYPWNLRGEGVPVGRASVILTRDAGGVPVDVLLLTASRPQFGDAAVTAVRKWRFTPAQAGERRVQRTQVLTFEFTARGVFLLPAGGPSPTEDRTFGVRRKPAPAFLPFEQLDSPPAAVVQAMPRFPAALIGHVDRGWAEVDFLVDESGRVRVPVVRRESAREFGDAALAVISRWRFTAPRRHGRPVVAAAGWRFEFEPAAPRAEDAK